MFINIYFILHLDKSLLAACPLHHFYATWPLSPPVCPTWVPFPPPFFTRHSPYSGAAPHVPGFPVAADHQTSLQHTKLYLMSGRKMMILLAYSDKVAVLYSCVIKECCTAEHYGIMVKLLWQHSLAGLLKNNIRKMMITNNWNQDCQWCKHENYWLLRDNTQRNFCVSKLFFP